MKDPILENLFHTCSEAITAANEILVTARQALMARISRDGKINTELLEKEQFAAHGFAWLNTYVEGLRHMLAWGQRLDSRDALGELELLMVQAAFGEYLNQIDGGIAISQVEVVRLSDIGIEKNSRWFL